MFREGGLVPPLWTKSKGTATSLLALGWISEFQGLIVRGDSAIVESGQLRGARIGVARRVGQPIDFPRAIRGHGILRSLNFVGLDDDVELIELVTDEAFLTDAPPTQSGSLYTARENARSQTNEILALVRGDVDAIFTSGGYGREITEVIDARVIVDLPRNSPNSWGNHLRVLTVSTELLTRERDLVVEYVAALFEAAAWASTHHRDATRIIAAELGLAEEWVLLGNDRATPAHLFQNSATRCSMRRLDGPSTTTNGAFSRSRSTWRRGSIRASLTTPANGRNSRSVVVKAGTTPETARRRRHPWQWVATIVILGAVAMLTSDFRRNQNLGWSDVRHFLFASVILQGLVVTIELTVVAQLIAVALGFVLAAMQQSSNPVLSRLAWLYVFGFRAVPLLVQVLFWYNLALVFPKLSFGLPFTPWHIGGSTNTLITSFMAIILALGLHEAAYMAEIVRAGILGVGAAQTDAALSVGLTRRRAMRYVILPQALRVIIPPTGNQFIGLLKASSLVSVIGGDDLLTRAENIYAVNFKVVALLMVASLWYLVLTVVATIGQHYIEARLSRDARNPHPISSRPGLARRVRLNLSLLRPTGVEPL